MCVFERQFDFILVYLEELLLLNDSLKSLHTSRIRIFLSLYTKALSSQGNSILIIVVLLLNFISLQKVINLYISLTINEYTFSNFYRDI